MWWGGKGWVDFAQDRYQVVFLKDDDDDGDYDIGGDGDDAGDDAGEEL